MNGQLEVKYEKREMPEYVRDILTAGASRLFLPAGFVEDGGLLFGHYRTEGYRKLSLIRDISTEAVFSVILSLLHGIWQTERVYVFSELYEILPDCIYVDRALGEAKLIYVPSELTEGSRTEGGGVRPQSLGEKLELLMKYLRSRGRREGWSYMDKAMEILKEDWGYKALISRLEELRREIYLCGVK